MHLEHMNAMTLLLQLFAKDRGKCENQIHLAGRTPEVALVVIIISNLY